MRYDIFRQSTGNTLFATRFELLARVVTHFCRSLDYAETGKGYCGIGEIAYAAPLNRELCEVDHDSIQWDN